MLFFNEWRVAARAASAAERAVSEAFMLFFNGKGPAPSEEQVELAKRSRELADDLFNVACRDWGDHRGRPPTRD
ncbi:hypothetical protein ACFPOE_04675 [Caenimonas terrae]|uniref:Uncharacterized protein n=1 Tax=Caenimonas terrae TaxID=696074 RepID=A0ABW0N825_9BURK